MGNSHDNDTLAWLGMAAYAMHILEEYTLDWRGWSHAVLGLPTEWNDFYVTNCIVVALGIALRRHSPSRVLSYAGLEFINAVLMLVTPFIRTRGRFSPGLITGVLFFLPVSIATFWTAWTTGMASIGEIGVGLLIGALTLAFPICMLIVKSWPYPAGRARLTLKSGERWKIGASGSSMWASLSCRTRFPSQINGCCVAVPKCHS
jgi:hypothetical protein